MRVGWSGRGWSGQGGEGRAYYTIILKVSSVELETTDV